MVVLQKLIGQLHLSTKRKYIDSIKGGILMSQSFLNKVTPLINHEERLVREFASYVLNEFPFTPSKVVNEQLTNALHADEKERDTILVWGQENNVTEETFPILMKLLQKVKKSKRHLVLQYVMNLPSRVLVDKAEQLTPYIGTEYTDFNKLLLEASEDTLCKTYESVVENVNRDGFNALEFQKSKKLLGRLIEIGSFGKQEVEETLQQEQGETFFSVFGILAVRAVGLLQLNEYIPTLVSLLDRDEDILLEELAVALSSFQSDDVVEAVTPYAMNNETCIYAASILKETKTEKAIEVLIKSYDKLDESGKETVIESLTAHLTEQAFPMIEDYLHNGYHGGLIDLEQTLYAFYTVMGRSHPSMEEWKQIAEQNVIEFEQEQQAQAPQPVVSDKVGRNDSCPCGSGKKYKKCCGK